MAGYESYEDTDYRRSKGITVDRTRCRSIIKALSPRSMSTFAVGFSALVDAKDKEEATEKLREAVKNGMPPYYCNSENTPPIL